VCPRQVEDPIPETPVLVFLDQAQGCVASLADSGDNIDRGRFFCSERDAITDRDDRIQHGALTAGERPGEGRCITHRLLAGNRISAVDEPQAVGLIRDFSDVRAVHGHQMKHPGSVLALGAGPARAENRPLPSEDLGLNNEIAERRMQRIRRRRGEGKGDGFFYLTISSTAHAPSTLTRPNPQWRPSAD
jgi:hypothetical protein